MGVSASSFSTSVDTRNALIAYSLGLTGLIMVKVLAPGFYARQDIRTVDVGKGGLEAQVDAVARRGGQPPRHSFSWRSPPIPTVALSTAQPATRAAICRAIASAGPRRDPIGSTGPAA